MARTSYLIKPGTTAEDLAEERAYAAMLAKNAADTSPKGHWAHIPAQMFQGLLGGWEGGEIEAERRRQQDEAAGLFGEAYDALGGGAMSGGAKVPSIASAAPDATSGLVQPARAAAAAAGRADENTLDMRAITDRIIGHESAGRVDARNPLSTAAGPGQFIDSTWLEMMRRKRPDLVQGRTPQQILALRTDPDLGAQLGREMTQAYAESNAEQLKAAGLPVTAGSLRLAHLLGPAGAKTVMSTGGNVPLAEVLPGQVLAANPFMQGMTAGQLRAWSDRQMGAGRSIASTAPDMPHSIAISAPSMMPAAATAPRRADRLAGRDDLMQRLYRNEATRPIATAILSAQLKDKDKEAKRHVVAPGASLVDDQGRTLFTAPQEDATAKARQTAIGKGQGEARLALPATVTRAEETIGILNRLRAHPGLDSGTGATGIAMTRIPGTDAYDFDQLRTQVQGTAFLTAIGEMRGTGAISNVEGEAATQAVARMRAAQSKGAFLEALGDYERVVRKGVANTYRQAGLEVPPELLGGTAPRAGAEGAPAAGTPSPQTNAAAAPSAAPDAPGGLSEGQRIRDTASGEVLVVRGGKLVPENAAPAVAPAEPASPGRASMAAAGRDQAEVPAFKGPWTADRRALIDNPSIPAMAAFDAFYGRGKAAEVLRSDYRSNKPAASTPGRYGYRAGR